MGYNYYPFRFLANDYNIDSNIIFQYQPKWFNENENVENVITEYMINNMPDFINDLNTAVIEKEDSYELNITYSDKYSKNTIEHFAKTYKLILSQIIEINELSDINLTTEEDIKLLNSYNQTECTLKYVLYIILLYIYIK